MKTNYFFKVLTTMLLAFLVTNVTAKQFRVAEPATDAELAAVLEQAENGDEIIISGYIEITAPITVVKNVTFIGENGDPLDDGFDAYGACKLFELNPDPVEGHKLVFKDLGFFGGYNADDDGGVGRILTGTTEFSNCCFGESKTLKRGGAFYIPAPEDGVVNVKFQSCVIENNIASNRGGAFFITGKNVNTTFEFCKITGNQTEIDGESRGGGFWIEGGTSYFYYCLIMGNASGQVGAGGERGGGAFVTDGNPGPAITLESCAVWLNTAYGNHGAAFFVMGTPNITLINSSVVQNLTKEGAGSWFIPSSDCDITLVNTIMTKNIGTNSGNAGGGFRVMNNGNRINLFNSIVIGNDCDNKEGAIDFGISDKPGIADGFVFKNSIVGLINGIDASVIPAPKDKAGINGSLINMYSLGGGCNPDWTEMDESGVDFTAQPLKTTGFGMPYYTLKDANVYAAKMGDPALLAEYDRSTDMFDKERTVTGGAIFAGPTQSVTGSQQATDPDIPVSIKQVASPDTKENIRIIGASNGILGVDFGALRGIAKGTLLNVAGQEVENVFSLNVVGKGYYNIHAAPGMYILKVEIGGKMYAQKFIVTK